MTLFDATVRRVRSAWSLSELVERDRELSEMRQLLSAAQDGSGALVYVEAPVGQGKTALLRAMRSDASARGLRVLAAVGAELERDFPFGVVRQLLEPELNGRDPVDRARLFEGAAALAQPLFEPTEMAGTADRSFARLHGLYWVLANLSDEQPTVVVIDDAHWADAPSLRFADALARRLEGLPVVLAVAARPSEPGAPQNLLDNLLTAPVTHLLRPRSLTADGVGELVTRSLGEEVQPEFVCAVSETTAGSPLLLRELLRALADQGFAGRRDEVNALRHALPGNVERIVVARLRRLPREASAVARSLAVLGDGCRLSEVASLTQMSTGEVQAGHETLARTGLVEPDELRFIHPLVRSAAHADLVGGVRAEWHRRAACVRFRAGADPVQVAAHLLETEPEGDAWAGEALAAAGRRALLEGAPEVAVRHLRRALAESPHPSVRQSTLLALGQAEARAGGPEAISHLEEAAGLGGPLAVEADRLRAQVLLLQERAGESVEILRRALEGPSGRDPVLAAEIENDLIDVLAHHAPLRDEYLRRLRAGASEERPTLLAHLAFRRAIEGAPAPEVRDLAQRALAERPHSEGHFIHYYAMEALMLIEAATESADALRRATALVHQYGSSVVAGPLTYMTSSWAAWERAFGDLRHAEEQAREGLALMLSANAPAVVVTLRASLGAVLLDRGRLREADDQLGQLPPRESGPGLKETHAIRARLRLLEGRFDEALAQLEIEFELESRRGWSVSNREPSRATWVRVLLGLGRREQAHEIAQFEVTLAQRRRVAGAEARARSSLALTLDGDDALREWRRAAEAAHASPSRLIEAETLGELGAALRRAGERAAARDLLAEARELAHRCGATALEARIHDELLVAGARPRRIALSGAASLTAAERRVAELAAQGLRNREIAQALFVSLKTVEVHLRHVYSKLEIGSRSQLGEALEKTTGDERHF